MQIYLISFFTALTVYLTINISISSSGRVNVIERICLYFTEENTNDVQEQFIKEKI